MSEKRYVVPEAVKDLLLPENCHRKLEGFTQEINLLIIAAYWRGLRGRIEVMSENPVYRMVCPHGRVLLIGNGNGYEEYMGMLQRFGGRIERITIAEARTSEMFCETCQPRDQQD